MATLQQLETALVNADKAGDQDAARQLAAVIQRARQDPANQIPDSDVQETIPRPEEPTFGQQIAGAGETALALGTGATGGTIGMIGGTLKGLAEQLLSGQFGTQQAADAVERSAMQGAEALTRTPRTQAGQEITQVVGEGLGQLAPAMGLTGELGMIAQGAKLGAPAIAPAARGALAETQNVLRRSETTEPESPVAATPATQLVPKQVPIPAAQPLASAELSAATREAATGSGKSQTRAQQVLAEQASPSPEVLEAAKRLKIEDNLQPDHVSTNQAYRELSQAVKSVPGSAARSQEIEGLQAVARRADDLVEELGGTHDLSTLSQGVKERMYATQEGLDSRANKLYQQIREAIPANTRVETPAVLEFIGKRADDLGGAENLSPIERMVVRKLTPKDGVSPTYTLMDDVRSSVGSAARMAGQFKDADTGLAKKLYALITADQEAAVAPFGMTSTIDAAKAAVKARKGLEDDIVSLFGKYGGNSLVGDLSAGTKALAAGDTSRFVKMINKVPEQMRQEVTASALNYAFGKSAKTGNISFDAYTKWYDGLRKNKQAYNAVMSNLPKEARESLHDLYLVSKGISSGSKERIMTGRLSTIIKELEGENGTIQKIYEAVKGASKGLAAEVGTSAIGAPGVGLASGIVNALSKGRPEVIRAADKLISSPEFIAAAKATARGDLPKKAAVKKLAKTPQAKKFFNSIKPLPPEMRDPEAWLLGIFPASNQPQNQTIH